MALQNIEFEGIIDYNKIDQMIDFYFESYINRGDYEKLDQSMFFLYCGGSASNVGSLVTADSKFDIIPPGALKFDSEIIEKLNIIEGLDRLCSKIKHGEKMTADDIIRNNEIFSKLYEFEMETQEELTPPFVTTRPYRITLENGLFAGTVFEVKEGRVFSDEKGSYQFDSESRRDAFRETLKYITEKFFTVANEKGVSAPLVIDDHMETSKKDPRPAYTAITLLNTAKDLGAKTQGSMSLVKEEVGLARGVQRYLQSAYERPRLKKDQETGETIFDTVHDISKRTDAIMQYRTYRGLVDLAEAMLEHCDVFMMSHKNTDNHEHQLVAYKDATGNLQIVEGQEGWHASFLRGKELPENEIEGLKILSWGKESGGAGSYSHIARMRRETGEINPEELENREQVFVLR